MRVYHLSSLQKIDLSIATFMFCLFIGFLRPLILNKDINTRNIIAFTLLFFAWYGSTLLFTNAFNYQSLYNKLENI